MAQYTPPLRDMQFVLHEVLHAVDELEVPPPRPPALGPSGDSFPMAQYAPPLRDMQFVLHEVLHAVDELKLLPRHAEIDAQTMNAVLEEGGKFASQVLMPLNQTGDIEGCKLDQA